MTLFGMERADLNILLAVTAMFLGPILAFIVWLIQRRLTAKTTARLKENADAAETKLKAETAEKSRIAKEHKDLVQRFDALERSTGADAQSLALLRQEMLPMSEFMKRKMIDILMHPSDEFKIPDRLLEQVKEVGAALPPELEPLLLERTTSTNPKVTEQEKLVAEAFPIIVRLAELEAKQSPESAVTTVQLVSSTAKSTETKQAEESEAE